MLIREEDLFDVSLTLLNSKHQSQVRSILVKRISYLISGCSVIWCILRTNTQWYLQISLMGISYCSRAHKHAIQRISFPFLWSCCFVFLFIGFYCGRAARNRLRIPSVFCVAAWCTWWIHFAIFIRLWPIWSSCISSGGYWTGKFLLQLNDMNGEKMLQQLFLMRDRDRGCLICSSLRIRGETEPLQPYTIVYYIKNKKIF